MTNERNAQHMETLYAIASDGTRIAYDKTGTGPLLILLHCLPGTREYWHQYSYVEQLNPYFTVAAVDLRGFGASDAPTSADKYTEDRILGDVYAVADACGAERFLVWGHSYGSSIARQLAASSDRVLRVVMAGGIFGAIFSLEDVSEALTELEPLAEAQRIGTTEALAALDIPPEEYAEVMSFPAASVIAIMRSLANWRQVLPGDIRCPLLVYSGTADDRVLEALQPYRAELATRKIPLIVFDGLNHDQLVSERAIVLPRIQPFLEGKL